MGLQARGLECPHGCSPPQRPASGSLTSQLASDRATSCGRRQAGAPQPPQQQPQLVFELGSATGAMVARGGARLAARPNIKRATTLSLAAIQNFGELEGIRQRSAPLRTVTFHLAQPVARLCGGLGAAVERTPLEARRFVAGAIAGERKAATAWLPSVAVAAS